MTLQCACRAGEWRPPWLHDDGCPYGPSDEPDVRHAPDCGHKGTPIAECPNCRPWAPDDGPYLDALSGWFDKPGGTRFDCSCSAGPTQAPGKHARTCRFSGPVVAVGRGRSYPDMHGPPRDSRQDMKDLLLRMRHLVGELDRLLEKSK